MSGSPSVTPPELDAVMRTLEMASATFPRRPMTIGSISDDSGIRRRIVERAVEVLRGLDHQIAAGPRGLWLEPDPAKYVANVQRRRHRAFHQLRNANREMRSARRPRGQMKIEDAA